MGIISHLSTKYQSCTKLFIRICLKFIYQLPSAMSDNVGLSTPRGSGTSGYVQRNHAHIRPRDRGAPYPPKDSDALRHRPRQPDQGILDHERKRAVALKVYELRLELLDEMEKEEEELNELNEKCSKLREKLEGGHETGKDKVAPREKFKGHQVHEMADAKLKEMDKWGRALKIPSNYEEGSHWRRQKDRRKKRIDRKKKRRKTVRTE